MTQIKSILTGLLMIGTSVLLVMPGTSDAATVVFQFQDNYGRATTPAVSLTPVSVPLIQSNAIVLSGLTTFRWPTNGLAVDSWGDTNFWGWTNQTRSGLQLILPLSAGGYTVQVSSWPRSWSLTVPNSTNTFYAADLSSNTLILTPQNIVNNYQAGIVSNAAPTSASGVSLNNGVVVVSTNYDSLGTAAATQTAIQAQFNALTNGFVDRSVTNGALNALAQNNGGALTNVQAASFAGTATNYLISTQYLVAAQTTTPFTQTATNTFLINVPVNPSLSGFYTLSNNFVNGGLVGWIYTNPLSMSEPLGVFTVGTYLLNNGNGDYQAYLPQKGLNGGGVTISNLPACLWYHGGQTIQGMIAEYAVATITNNAVQLMGSFVGDAYGNNHASLILPANTTPLPPVDPSWNIAAEPVPQIVLATWPSLFSLNAITNALAFCASNSIAVDALALDISFISYSNNIYGEPIQGVAPYFVSCPGGLPNLITQVHNLGYKIRAPLERYDIGIGNYASNGGYNYSPVTNLFNDMTRVYQYYEFDGVDVDHFNNTFTLNAPLVSQTEFAYSQTIYNAIQQFQASTNWTANNNITFSIRPFNVFFWGLSKFDFMMNVANEYDVDDLVIQCNGTVPPTGTNAEVNYEQWQCAMTNMASWVRPGHFLYGGGLDTLASSVDVSNALNLHALTSSSIGITCQGGNISATTGSPTNLANALKNTEIVNGILKDPLGKFGLPVVNWKAQGTNIDLWVKPLKGGSFAIGLWNHNWTNVASIVVSNATIDSTLSGQATILRDPWGHTDLQTNNSTFSLIVPPLTISLFTVRLQPNFYAGSFSGNGVNLTNLPYTPPNYVVWANADLLAPFASYIGQSIPAGSQPVGDSGDNMTRGFPLVTNFQNGAGLGFADCYGRVRGTNVVTEVEIYTTNTCSGRWTPRLYYFADNYTNQVLRTAMGGGSNPFNIVSTTNTFTTLRFTNPVNFYSTVGIANSYTLTVALPTGIIYTNLSMVAMSSYNDIIITNSSLWVLKMKFSWQ